MLFTRKGVYYAPKQMISWEQFSAIVAKLKDAKTADMLIESAHKRVSFDEIERANLHDPVSLLAIINMLGIKTRSTKIEGLKTVIKKSTQAN